jgi:hypothetical protein
MKKEAILSAIRAHIAQRSGIDFRNYQSGDYQASRRAFLGDYRPILKHGRDARALLDFIENRDEITAENIKEATRAFSGRLSLVERGDSVAADYCTGQYFPTEYRAAACAVLALAVWDYWREDCESGEEIRKRARRRFGRGLASRWFN